MGDASTDAATADVQSVTADAPDAEVDAYDALVGSPTLETHALGLNDISMLFQIPEHMSGTTLARITGVPGYQGPLVSPTVFATLVGSDVTHAFETFHVVSLRYDLCDRGTTAPCTASADAQFRIVFQPIIAGSSFGLDAADTALHAFYPIPAADVPGVVKELRALARLRDFQTESQLAVNEALASTSPPSEYRARLRALVARYAKASNLLRLTLFTQDAQEPAFNWIFRGLERAGVGYQPITIGQIATTEQRTTIIGGGWPSKDATPKVDVPAGFVMVLDADDYRAAPFADRKAALEGLTRIENPTLHGAGDQQCVTCHLTTFLLTNRAKEENLTLSAIAGAFTSTHNLSVGFGISTDSETSMRNFGWFLHYPAISRRVANESAVVLDEIDARYPPQDPTLIPDYVAPPLPPPVKRVFVTSSTFNGNLAATGVAADGLAGADKLCAAAAQNANLGGTWVAWLSTSTTNAIDRIGHNGPWYLVDRTTLVFPAKGAILSGPLVPIDLSEYEAQPPGWGNVWTGTGSNGHLVDAAHNCSDWTTSQWPADGTTGVRFFTTTAWTGYYAAPCNESNGRLYCFEQ